MTKICPHPRLTLIYAEPNGRWECEVCKEVLAMREVFTVPDATPHLTENVRAVLRLISPEHITPLGKRQVERVLDEHTHPIPPEKPWEPPTDPESDPVIRGPGPIA